MSLYVLTFGAVADLLPKVAIPLCIPTRDEWMISV